MTQQGKRQARFREWAGTSLTYNGDMMSAGRAASGITDGTVNEAEWWLHGAISGTTATTLSGRQAATAERLNVPSGWDAVGDELPIAGWDFTSGGLFPGLTYGNPVAGAVSRDSLIYRSSGEARSSSLGLLVEKEVTNKCVNTNMKPTDTTGTTPDAAWTTHEALDLGSIPSEVFDALPTFTQGKLTHVYHSISNGAGQIVIDGVTGNTGTHTPSEWHYTVSGDFGTGLSSIGASHDPTVGVWQRFEKPGTPAAGTDTQVVGSSQASEVYWFGNQLEENTGRTSLIEVAGSAVTRLADYVTTSLTLPDMNAFTFVLEFQAFLTPSAGTFPRILEANNSADPETTRLSAVLSDALSRIAGTVTYPGSYTLDAVERWAYGNDAGTLNFSVDGGTSASGVYTPPSSFTTLIFGSANSTTQNKLNGYVRNVAVYDSAATEATVERLSA